MKQTGIMAKELLTEIEIGNFGNKLIIRCPDKDDEIVIIIKERYKSFHSLTIDEAIEIKNFLAKHIKNMQDQ